LDAAERATTGPAGNAVAADMVGHRGRFGGLSRSPALTIVESADKEADLREEFGVSGEDALGDAVEQFGDLGVEVSRYRVH
jgi:hypothetical protein